MKPTTAIKRIVALLEETESEEDKEALWAAIVALAGSACGEVLPQTVPYPVPYPVPTWPPPTPWIVSDDNTTGGGNKVRWMIAGVELPSETWTTGAAGMLEPANE